MKTQKNVFNEDIYFEWIDPHSCAISPCDEDWFSIDYSNYGSNHKRFIFGVIIQLFIPKLALQESLLVQKKLNFSTYARIPFCVIYRVWWNKRESRNFLITSGYFHIEISCSWKLLNVQKLTNDNENQHPDSEWKTWRKNNKKNERWWKNEKSYLAMDFFFLARIFSYIKLFCDLTFFLFKPSGAERRRRILRINVCILLLWLIVNLRGLKEDNKFKPFEKSLIQIFKGFLW